MALTAKEKAALSEMDFAVPGKRKLPIHDKAHVTAAWHMLMRTKGLTDDEVIEARRRILARAKKLGIDTTGWKKNGQTVSKESHDDLPLKGQSIMRDLTSTLQQMGIEGLQEPTAPASTAEPTAPAMEYVTEVTLESLDAVHTAGQDMEDAVVVMDELYESQASLEAIAMAIEGTLTEGGMSPQTAAMAQVALRNEQKRLGMTSKSVSLEAYEGPDRRPLTEIALESVKETLVKIWEAIVKVAKAVWDAIKRFYAAIISWIGSAGKKAEELIKRIKNGTAKSLKISLENISLESAEPSVPGAEFTWLLTDGKQITKGSLKDLDAVLKYPEVFVRSSVPENLLEATHYDSDEAKHKLKAELAAILKGWGAKAHECGFTQGNGQTHTTALMPGDVRFALTFPQVLAEGSDAIQALNQVASGPTFAVQHSEGKHRPTEIVLVGNWVTEVLEEVVDAEKLIKETKQSLDEVITNSQHLLDEAKSRLVDNDKYLQQAVRIYLQGMGRQIQSVGRTHHTVVSILIKVARAAIKVGEVYAKAA